ncbi:unnamed protein product, partial [Ectocarpus sp. 8 AP-2014]
GKDDVVRRFFGNGERPADFAPVLQGQHLKGATGSGRTKTGGFAALESGVPMA